MLTAPAGSIVTDLRGDIAGGLVRLAKIDDDTVEGRFDPYPAAQLHLAGHYTTGMVLNGSHLFAAAPDWSWVEVIQGAPHRVAQGGPRRIWDSVESTYELWRRLDQPALDRYGLTATDDPEDQRVWLDQPDSPYSWPLPL